MNKERYNQIIDEVYETYNKEIIRQREIQKEEVNRLRSQWKRVRVSLIELLTKEEFINKCKTDDALSIKWREEYRDFRYGSKEEIEHLSKHYKTDPEFSEKWGLTIEERELSLLERYELMKKLDNWIPVHYKEPKTMEYMDKHNIPTKLITITYNNETVESYE